MIRRWFEDTYRLTNVYVTAAGSMEEALGKASRYADHQLIEENADTIKHISVTEIGDAVNEG